MTMDSEPGNRIIYSGAIFSCILWASAFIGGKYALGYIPPLHLAGYRLILASIMVMLVLRRNPFPLMKDHMRWVLLLSLLQTVYLFIFFNLGLSRVPGALGSMIIGSGPAISSILAVTLLPDERMTIRKVIGLSIGLTGIIILAVSREPWTETGVQELIGVLMLLSCNISSALGSVLIKKRLSAVPSLAMNAAQMIIGAVVVMVLALLFEPARPLEVTVPILLSVGYLGFITAAAVSIWLTIIKLPHVRISNISLWKFLIPSLGPALSWILLPDESPTLSMVLGMVAIVVAILFTVSDAKDRKHVVPNTRGDDIISQGANVS